MNQRKNCMCVVVTLLALWLSSCEGQKEIVQGLSEPEANEILVVLDSQKITGTKNSIPGREISFTISVKESKVVPALKLLVDNKLPREKQRGFAQVYPHGKGGMIPTRNEERARFLMGIQGQIENMLEVLPGVVKARVAVVLPSTGVIRDLNTPAPRATASVALVYNQVSDELGLSISKEEIQQLVASAVEDLRPSDVTVVLSPNQRLVLVGDKEETTTPESVPVANYSVALAGLEVSNEQLSSEFQEKLAAFLVAHQAEVHKSHQLVWIFGVLASSALLFGVVSFVRLTRLRKSLLIKSS